MITEDLNFEQQQEARAEFSRWYLDTMREAIDVFERMIFHALGLPYFWDLPPRERKAIYAGFPPTIDGQNPAPFAGAGPWNWPQIAAAQPEKYDRHLKDFATLLKDEIQRLEVRAEGGVLAGELEGAYTVEGQT